MKFHKVTMPNIVEFIKTNPPAPANMLRFSALQDLKSRKLVHSDYTLSELDSFMKANCLTFDKVVEFLRAKFSDCESIMQYLRARNLSVAKDYTLPDLASFMRFHKLTPNNFDEFIRASHPVYELLLQELQVQGIFSGVGLFYLQTFMYKHGLQPECQLAELANMLRGKKGMKNCVATTVRKIRELEHAGKASTSSEFQALNQKLAELKVQLGKNPIKLVMEQAHDQKKFKVETAYDVAHTEEDMNCITKMNSVEAILKLLRKKKLVYPKWNALELHFFMRVNNLTAENVLDYFKERHPVYERMTLGLYSLRVGGIEGPLSVQNFMWKHGFECTLEEHEYCGRLEEVASMLRASSNIKAQVAGKIHKIRQIQITEQLYPSQSDEEHNSELEALKSELVELNVIAKEKGLGKKRDWIRQRNCPRATNSRSFDPIKTKEENQEMYFFYHYFLKNFLALA